MRYIKTYDEIINEGILNMFKSLFKGVKKIYTNIKGGKKLEEILNKYKQEVDTIFAKLLTHNQTDKATNISEAEVQTEQPQAQTDNNQQQSDNQDNQEEESDSTSPHALDKTDVKELIRNNKQRLEVMKKRFNKEIDMFLSKNKTDKLETLSFLTKNQFEDYVYGKMEELFTKANDRNSLKQIVKLRNNVKTQMANDIKKINAEHSVKATENVGSVVEVGVKYNYTNKDNKTKSVEVVAIDKDKNGKDNNLLAEVKNDEGGTFFVFKDKLKKIETNN